MIGVELDGLDDMARGFGVAPQLDENHAELVMGGGHGRLIQRQRLENDQRGRGFALAPQGHA